MTWHDKLLLEESGIDSDSYVSPMFDNSDFSENYIRIDALARLVCLTKSEAIEFNHLLSLQTSFKDGVK